MFVYIILNGFLGINELPQCVAFIELDLDVVPKQSI
jgi:hypothetical protein